MAFRRERLVVFGRTSMLSGSGILMGLGGYLGLFWALAGIACAQVLLAFLWLHRSMITPNCGISGGALIYFYVLIQRVSQLTRNARDNDCYF